MLEAVFLPALGSCVAHVLRTHSVLFKRCCMLVCLCVCVCEVPLVGVGLGAVCRMPLRLCVPVEQKGCTCCLGASRGPKRMAQGGKLVLGAGEGGLQRTKDRSAAERDMDPVRPDLPVLGD